MLFAQISDLHLAAPGEKTYGIAPMAENLTLCIDHINGLNPAPELVLVTGDIANDATQEQTQRAADLLANLNAPYYVIPGNHDDRDVLWSVFGGAAIPERSGQFQNYVIDRPQLRLIGLDSVKAGEPGGEICETRLAWLADRFAEEPAKPTAIFMHHPPCKFGIVETDQYGFDGAEGLAQLIGEQENIICVFSGHIHLIATSSWAGTVVNTAPSMGMQLALDLTMKKPSAFIVEAPAYQLHKLRDGMNIITHNVTVKDVDGPHLF